MYRLLYHDIYVLKDVFLFLFLFNINGNLQFVIFTLLFVCKWKKIFVSLVFMLN